MARIPILMPSLGSDAATGRIAAWLRGVGDVVRRGDAIAEIETEKATIEMEALASGTLVEISYGPGDEVPVGATVGILDDGTK